MIKTIKIGDKDVELDNNIVWALNYRNQFGKDIIPTLMPLAAAIIDIISGVVRSGATDDGALDFRKMFENMDDDAVTNAVIHLSGLELNDFIELTWALAKTADASIPEPEKWLRQFDAFPLDEVGPAVFDMVISGIVSSKNLKRLEDLKKTLQPKSDLMTSSSQQQSED